LNRTELHPKTLQLFKKESPVVSRELAQDQYMAGDYLVGKLLAELPLDALVSLRRAA
jgi:hypothetical protein